VATREAASSATETTAFYAQKAMENAARLREEHKREQEQRAEAKRRD
jgi:hypothetical protein